MFQIATSVLALVAIGIAFWSPVASWGLLIVPLALFSIALFSAAQEKVRFHDLSPKANELLVKFWHFYFSPLRSRDVSGAASAVFLASTAVILIACYQGFWWGIAIGVGVNFCAGFLSRQFNPAGFLVDDDERQAHEEVIAWVLNHPNLWTKPLIDAVSDRAKANRTPPKV